MVVSTAAVGVDAAVCGGADGGVYRNRSGCRRVCRCRWWCVLQYTPALQSEWMQMCVEEVVVVCTAAVVDAAVVDAGVCGGADGGVYCTQSCVMMQHGENE